MNKRTLKALQGSIAKWQAIVDGTGVDKGIKNCPLCLLFNNDDTFIAHVCVGCPVMERTGKRFCRDTPHEKWVANCKPSDELNVWVPGGERGLEAARAELDFLKSLLPEGA